MLNSPGSVPSRRFTDSFSHCRVLSTSSLPGIPGGAGDKAENRTGFQEREKGRERDKVYEGRGAGLGDGMGSQRASLKRGPSSRD